MSLVKAFDLLANCSWDGSLQAFGEAYLDALRPFGAKSLWSRSFQLTRNWHDPEVSGRYKTDDHARIRQADWLGSAAQRYADRHCPLAMGATKFQRPFFASEIAPHESRAYADYWAAMAEFGVRDTFAASHFGPRRTATALSIWFTGTDFSPAELQAIRLSTVIAIDHLRAPEPEESDDEGADAGGDEQPMMEFWDEAEEAQFQKMVIHFGRERAEIALYEMRRIKEKKGEAPINRRPGMNLVPLGSAAAAAAAGVAPPPKAEQPAKVKEVKQLTPEEQARQERAAHMLAQVDLGNDRAVKQALEAGVDVNSADEQGNTGLHLAAINGDKKMVSVFLKNKVRKNGKSTSNMIVFEMR